MNAFGLSDGPQPVAFNSDSQRQPSRFHFHLELHARQLIRARGSGIWYDEMSSFLEREIALTLNAIDRTRELNDHLRRNLLQQECYIDTFLMYLNRPKYPVHGNHDRRERQKDKLAALERERRQLSIGEEQWLSVLHEKLLTLFNRHRYVHPQMGSSDSFAHGPTSGGGGGSGGGR